MEILPAQVKSPLRANVRVVPWAPLILPTIAPFVPLPPIIIAPAEMVVVPVYETSPLSTTVPPDTETLPLPEIGPAQIVLLLKTTVALLTMLFTEGATE